MYKRAVGHFYHQGSYLGNGTRYPHSAPGPITDHHHKASRGVIYPPPEPTCSSLDPVGDRPCNPPPQPSAKPQPKKQRKKRAATSGSTTRTAATAPRKNAPKPTLDENAPAADGCHHPLPASIRSGVITKLEGAANESCSLNLPPNADDPSRNNPTPSLHVNEQSRNNPAPSLQQGLRSAPPLKGVSDPLPRKNKKCDQSQGEDGCKVLPAPRSYSKLLKDSIGNLVAEAQERSKGAMSNADWCFFVEFHMEQRKLLAIKAIEREVSVEMIDKFLGKSLPIQKPSDWICFRKTQPARDVFRGRGKRGIAQKDGMAWVSELYEAAGQKLPADAKEDRPSKAGDQSNVLTPSELALDNNSKADNNSGVAAASLASSRVGPPGLRATVLLAQASGCVQDFLDAWAIQANRVSKTYNCEMILFTVSKYLGRHSYQLTTTTHGATPFVQIAEDLDGPNTFGNRLHAWVVGHTSDYVSSALDPDPPNSKHSLKVTTRMARLAAKKTKNVFTTWPWTNCEERLAKQRFRLELNPRMRTPIKNITNPSCYLGPGDIRQLHLDLNDKFINIVQITTATSSQLSSRATKRVRSDKSSSHCSSRSGSRTPSEPSSPQRKGVVKKHCYSIKLSSDKDNSNSSNERSDSD
ncbi:hypothetical protein PtB15_3B93 [Puccinia triticina]|nr:hypothetical protein PtB15_3B93 [Puccinia triticina]